MKAMLGIRHVAVSLAALLALLGVADPCTVGAWTGRAPASCAAMDAGAMACPAGAAARQACCPCCKVPAREDRPSPAAGSCRDLKPQASGVAEQPSIGAPVPSAHPALLAGVVFSAPVTGRGVAFLAVPDESPPRGSPPPHSSRAPPLL